MVFIMYCCITNLSGFKQQSFINSQFLWVRNLGALLLSSSGSGCQKLQYGWWQACSSLKTEGDGKIFQVNSHGCGQNAGLCRWGFEGLCPALAICWSCRSFARGPRLGHLTAGLLSSCRVSQKKSKRGLEALKTESFVLSSQKWHPITL